MAASSRVNASVEKANLSTGWDEAHGKVSPAPAPVEIKKNNVAPNSPDDFGSKVSQTEDRSALQTQLRSIADRVRGHLLDNKSQLEKITKAMSRRMQWLKQEHPGYIVAGAAAAGFTAGIILRTKRSRRRIKSL